jgi:hypothetical protein
MLVYIKHRYFQTILVGGNTLFLLPKGVENIRFNGFFLTGVKRNVILCRVESHKIVGFCVFSKNEGDTVGELKSTEIFASHMPS